MSAIKAPIFLAAVGYLVKGKFYCPDCKSDQLQIGQPAPVPVFLRNITPYSQVCHECGDLMVDGWKRLDGEPVSLFTPPVEPPAQREWTVEEILAREG